MAYFPHSGSFLSLLWGPFYYTHLNVDTHLDSSLTQRSLISRPMFGHPKFPKIWDLLPSVFFPIAPFLIM